MAVQRQGSPRRHWPSAVPAAGKGSANGVCARAVGIPFDWVQHVLLLEIGGESKTHKVAHVRSLPPTQ
jgi:hypothetical protein